MKVLLAACVLVTGCAAPAMPEGRGGGARPTIVSLNPCSDAILAEVADPEQILAISHYSHDPRASSMDPAAARRFRGTGGTVEEVLALAPDVVVASSFLPPSASAAFADLRMPVTTIGMATSVAESVAQVRQLSAAAGHPERGERLIARIEAAVSGNVPRREPIPAVLWQPGGIVPGTGELISELMRAAGFTSHSAARGLGQADYLSLERVLADPPYALLIAGEERSQRHPAMRAVPSVRVARFDPALLYCGGPTIIRAMKRLSTIRSELPA